jgi:Flp pilus assembly protein TadD
LVAAGAGRGGTAGWDSPVGIGAYLLTQGEAVAGYLWHVVWPHPLVFDHGPVVTTLSGALVPGCFVLALVAASAWGVWRGHPLGFAGGAFFLCLAPSSSFVPIASQTMADHRMYLALAAPVAALVTFALRRAPRGGALAVGVAALVLTGVAAARHRNYRDEVTLWTETAARRPDNPRAHHNLGQAVFAQGDPAAAEVHFRRAERLRPGDPDTRYNLALCALRLGRAEEARAVLAENQGRAPDHLPTALALGEVRGELGRQALAAGRTSEAREHFVAAAALRPRDPRPRHNLGNVLLELDAIEAALAAWREALTADPSFGESRRALALVLLRTGRAAEALTHLERLAREEPDRADVRAALAEARQAVGR